ncbi:MAG: hypothetical protein ACLR70_02480 [Streptococcus thermophilus]
MSYDELYASVLDLYRPIALNGDTSAVPSNLSTEEAYSTNTIFEANRVGEKVQYSYVDINDDGSAEVLIDTHDSVHALYYLNNDDELVFAKSAGTFAKLEHYEILVPLISFNRLISAYLRRQMVQVRLAWETFRPWTCFPKTGTTLMTQVATI